MVCRCASPAIHAQRAEEAAYESASLERAAAQKTKKQLEEQIAALSPDPRNYEILDAAPVGAHLVVKAQYPSCKSCAFEGTKIMVFLNTTPLDALRWKQLDPHFRANAFSPGCAPSPAARFPGNPEGWADAIAYALGKATT
jgi:hypothetical protein